MRIALSKYENDYEKGQQKSLNGVQINKMDKRVMSSFLELQITFSSMF